MINEELELEEYREWLDAIYGHFQIRKVKLRGSKILEDYDPLGFQRGFNEYLLLKGEEYDTRN